MKTIRFFIHFLPLIFIFTNGFAQSSEPGQLEWTIQFDNAADDSVKVEMLLEQARRIRVNDIKQSQLFASQALELSKRLNYQKGLATSNLHLAQIFINYDFKLSEKLLLEAHAYAIKAGDSNLMAKINNTIGQLKNNLGESQAALLNFQLALEYYLGKGNDSIAAGIYNNLAISYKMLANDSLAMANYFAAAKINEKNGNYLWLASNYFNIGIDFLELGDTMNGIDYLARSLKIAKERNFPGLLPYLYSSFSKHYLATNDARSALQFARMALKSSREQFNRVQEKGALTVLKDIQYKTGNIDSAYLFLEEILAVNDSIRKYERMEELDFLDMKYKLDEELSQQVLKQKMLEAEHSRKEMRYLLIILGAGIILLVLVFLFVVQNSRIKRKNLEKKTADLETEKLKKELEYKNKELTTNVMYLLRKNELITGVSKKLQSLVGESMNERGRALADIINELDKNTSREIWKDFETRFKEIYGDFYQRLGQKYQGLTPNELKLCAFLKLNMSTKEISAITFQSPETLKIARYRLRKKLGLGRNDNIVSFLNQL